MNRTLGSVCCWLLWDNPSKMVGPCVSQVPSHRQPNTLQTGLSRVVFSVWHEMACPFIERAEETGWTFRRPLHRTGVTNRSCFTTYKLPLFPTKPPKIISHYHQETTTSGMLYSACLGDQNQQRWNTLSLHPWGSKYMCLETPANVSPENNKCIDDNICPKK